MPRPIGERLPGTLQWGVVVKFDAERGFGFIRPENSDGQRGQDVFVHIRDVEGQRILTPGQRVSYQLTRTDRGLVAIRVQAGSVLGTPYARYGLIGLAAAVVLLLLLRRALGLPSTPAFWLVLWVTAVSIPALAIYGYDKAQAQAGGTRVPELVLHGLSLIGGSPGAFAAMQLFHHKTQKPSFQTIFWLIVTVQASLLLFWGLNR